SEAILPDTFPRNKASRTDLAEEIARALGGAKKVGNEWVCRCPAHEDRTPSLSLCTADNGKLLLHCFAGCDPLIIFAELRYRGLLPERDDKSEYHPRPPLKPLPTDPARLPLARGLWRQRLPLAGPLAERSLRETRGCRGPVPCTVGFLPTHRDYPPALIAAYGLPDEPEPGMLALPIEAV